MFIFLDIDGVMVPANGWKSPEFLPDGFAVFSPKAVKALQKILHETNASLVLTTSHKSNKSLTEWRNIFGTRGIDAFDLSSLPDNDSRASRKRELINWFNGHRYDQNFVIIDDDKSLNDLPTHLKERLVLTDGSVGLTDQLADKAIAVLKNNVNRAQRGGPRSNH